MRTAQTVLVTLGLALFAACGGNGGSDADAQLKVWYHTGKPAEKACMERLVAAYNAREPAVPVELVCIPEKSYDQKVATAAASGSLPDVLDLDGPYVASYAWRGILRPLDGLVPAPATAGLLPSIAAQGTWRGSLYALGQFDSGLGLYCDRSKLAAIDARIPDSPEDAWSLEEFAQILADLAAKDADGQVLDLKLNDTGTEWPSYAFGPTLVSAGADWVERSDPVRATGTLDSPQAVRALTTIKSWIADGLVDPNTADDAFIERRVAISWVGHWMYPDYRQALGDDLVLVPLPDFGHGSRTGQGSWCWGVTRACERPDAAAAFIAFLLRDESIAAMCAANGAVPASRAVIADSPVYGPEGDLRLFATQLATIAVPRPVTPAYPVITKSLHAAYHRIIKGADPAVELAEAAERIDREVTANQGYP
ncbi:MAG: sugar ABC transporter substrate-binding protein [Planctomycetota bacterium]